MDYPHKVSQGYISKGVEFVGPVSSSTFRAPPTTTPNLFLSYIQSIVTDRVPFSLHD